jgi:hypothetical protein
MAASIAHLKMIVNFAIKKIFYKNIFYRYFVYIYNKINGREKPT